MLIQNLLFHRVLGEVKVLIQNFLFHRVLGEVKISASVSPRMGGRSMFYKHLLLKYRCRLLFLYNCHCKCNTKAVIKKAVHSNCVTAVIFFSNSICYSTCPEYH